MSVKENIEFVKHEIDSEEKMLESVIRIEAFLKKYKRLLLGAVGVVLLVIIGFAIRSELEESRKSEANALYGQLLQDQNSDSLRNKLKSRDENLYNLFLFSKALEKNSSVELKELIPKVPEIVALFGEYQNAMYTNSESALSSYLAKGDVPLKELALLTEAYMLIQNQKIDDAKRALLSIPVNSPIKSIANALMHFTITKGENK